MARRILLKENAVGTFSPRGYKFLGLKDSNLSIVGATSSVEEFNTPQNFLISSSFYDVEDLGNGFSVGAGLGNYQKVDYDLSGGNYYNISIENGTFNSFKLPDYWGKNLYNAMLQFQTLDSNPVEITLSKYPNLASIKGQGICFNGTKPYTFELKDDVIDSKNLKKIGFFGSKRCTPIKTGSSLKIVAHPDSTYTLGSNFLNSLEIDFSSFTYSTFGSINTKPTYNYKLWLFAQNVNYLTFSNISVYDDAPDSQLGFILDGIPLTKSSVDQILLDLDTAFPYNTTNSPSISILQEYTLTGGELVIGESYVIETLNGSDDFSNVGYVSPGVAFVATGTTPNDWTNSSTVFTFYGMIKDYTLEIIDQAPQDGKYWIGDFFVQISGGVITSSELLTPNVVDSSFYPGRVVTLEGENLSLTDEWGRIIFQGESGVHDLRFTVNSITRTSAPTDGQNNVNKLSLQSKGWKVNVNSY